MSSLVDTPRDLFRANDLARENGEVAARLIGEWILGDQSSSRQAAVIACSLCADSLAAITEFLTTDELDILSYHLSNSGLIQTGELANCERAFTGALESPGEVSGLD